jgi:monofunctional glycosyltransferase
MLPFKRLFMTKYFLKIKLLVKIAVTLLVLLVVARCFIVPPLEVKKLTSHYPVIVRSNVDDSDRYDFQKKRPTYWLTLKEISPKLVSAIIVSEDTAFYQHNGVDWAEMQNAISDSIIKGKKWRGASTLSQQLSKNLFLGPERTLWRKAQEVVYTYYLEKYLTKEKILELYLNSVEFGDKVYGVAPASELYFNKKPKNLTARESAFLAMLLPNPKKYAQSFYQKKLTRYAQKIITQVLYKMAIFHYIGLSEAQQELSSRFSWEGPAVDVSNDISGDTLYN